MESSFSSTPSIPPRCPLFAPHEPKEGANALIHNHKRQSTPSQYSKSSRRPNENYVLAVDCNKCRQFTLPPNSTTTNGNRKPTVAKKRQDEALVEASELRQHKAELEKKIIRLETYVQNLKFIATNNNINRQPFPSNDFLKAIQDGRLAVRYLSRVLITQIQQSKAMERIAILLHPYNLRVSSKNLYLYLEGLLNDIFYEDFELPGFKRGGSDKILDPHKRGESSRAEYESLRNLSWEDVVSSKGTRYHSRQFSGFCDRKMSMVVQIVGWDNGRWSEPLLRVFFEAAKWVWLVHLLARTIHPAVPLFRVGKGDKLDVGYMEDVVADKVTRPVSGTVRMMVAPGFYVHGSVVKCKVICFYHKNIQA